MLKLMVSIEKKKGHFRLFSVAAIALASTHGDADGEAEVRASLPASIVQDATSIFTRYFIARLVGEIICN